jgi:hypothetical protein
VSLTVPGCGSAPCDGTTTIDVPVLYPNLPIAGPTTLCVGASGTYTLPTLPGTYYTWTVAGGAYSFNQVDRNSPSVNVTFTSPGIFWVKCDYNNPMAGCNGVDSIQVNVLPTYTIFGDDKVCENSTTPYFGSGPANWIITPPGPTFTGNLTSTINVTWIPGTYFIKATPINSSAFCNDTAVKKVEVIALPILNNIIGVDSICPGKNLTYSISSNTSGSPFMWLITGGTGMILSQMGADKDSIVVKFMGLGPWQLSVSQEIEILPGIFCQSLTKVKDIYPFLAPSISGQTNVCVDAVEGYNAGGSNLSGNFQWTISPASQGTIQSGQGSNSVQILWHGPTNTATLTVSTCSGSDQINVNILNPPLKPVISANGDTEYCLPGLPNNLQLSVPNIYSSYQWYHNGILFGQTSNTYLIPNGTFTGAGNYVFSVVVSNGLCSVTSLIMIRIGTCGPGGELDPFECDTSIDFSWNPNPACANQQVTFWAVPASSIYSYAWDFGDLATSFQAPTQHIYTNPGSYNVSLTATYGTCIVDTIKSVTINPLPICNLLPSDTIFCPGDSVSLTACNGMSTYQWFKNGNPISGANGMIHYVKEHGEYWVEMSNSFGCFNNSDSLYIYMNSLPVARITGDRSYCVFPSTTALVNLSTVFDANYTYSWSSNPGGAIFTPSNLFWTQASINLPAVLPVIYEFIVTVNDITTGCQNNDTICMAFYESPSFTIPFLNACEGANVLLLPSLIDPTLYNYQWSNGATTPLITASSPGFYSLTMTNKANGCSSTQNAGSINPKPDLSLFPTGCDNMCVTDTFNIYIPLALNALPPLNTYPLAYPNIYWYSNGNYVGSGENLAYSPGVTGNYQISVTVENSFGCIDSAGVFCLSVDTTVTIIVSTETPCGCDSTITFNLVNAENEMDFYHFDMLDCLEEFTFCINNQETYNLVASNGIIIPNAIVNGVVNYPGGIPPFMIGDNGLCCFAYADSQFVKILTPITYNSDMVWDNKYYIHDGVIVTVNGSVLDITNVDVVFGECAGIEFINGGYLRANNSVFRPCNMHRTWKGLRFENPVTTDTIINMINECTFKNAEVALYFRGGSDGLVSNNLFSNCNYGIRVESNNHFNHPISGNRFVTETFFPDYLIDCRYFFINNTSTYGIYSTSSRFLQQVSDNEFINSINPDVWPRTYGIFQKSGGGQFTLNSFTDYYNAFWFETQNFYSTIQNNKIESNVKLTGFTTIYINSCKGPIIEVNKNEISNNYNQFVSPWAIYATKSSNVSIQDNLIDGFSYGILSMNNDRVQVSNNEVRECQTNGIYILESPGQFSYITCNVIKMKTYSGTTGMLGQNMSSLSEVSSNCILDCANSMYFGGSNTLPALPRIRNNFLYNYNNTGINVSNHSGNIGTATDHGMNTLWSNNNAAVDINSNSGITVANNFGMFNISWPFVQITSNNPYHSTASCGHQIFNMPSQGNLNVNYTCDNFKKITQPMVGMGGYFIPPQNIGEWLSNSANPFHDAGLILTNYENPGIEMLNEVIQNAKLSVNETTLLKYSYNFRNSDYENARTELQNFVPSSPDEEDFKALCLMELTVTENGWDDLSDEMITKLNQIIEKGSVHSNFAIFMLNNSSTYRDYVLEDATIPEVFKSEQVKHIEPGDSFLNIYPNPASNSVFIELVNNNTENGKLELFDISGKRVIDFTLNIVAGGIELDIRNLREGFYIVTLTDPESGYIQKGKLVKSAK